MKGIIIILCTSLATLVASDSSFSVISNALLCIRSAYAFSNPRVKSALDCSLLCYKQQRCKAFSIVDGWCKLFVFDKCSKYVRECSCNRTGVVYVKRQSGLSAGALCPSGFADDYCGTKYKFYAGIKNWNLAKTTIEAEPGLVIMADVTDVNEQAYIKAVTATTYSGSSPLMLGGTQPPGSPEPAGGWIWVSCSISIDATLWNSAEPNNAGDENTVAITKDLNIYDNAAQSNGYAGALAECLSPFV